MDTRQDNRRSDVIRCEYCGEDYSVTYRQCPFCDDRASYVSDRVPSRGGKRVATNRRGGGYGGGMQPVQVIGVILSIILIIAAAYIVFTVLGPLFDGGGSEDVSGSASISQSQSDVSSSAPNMSVSGEVSTPVVPDVSDSSGVITPVITATGISLNKKDVTLQANEFLQLVATLAPEGSTDTVTWTSSNEEILTVTQNGTVTNVNKGAEQVTVTVMAQVGELKAACLVRCKGGSTGNSTSSGSGTSSGTSTGTTGKPVAAGTIGTVTGAGTGLLIRSGPGRTYEAQDTAPNGTEVKILEQTADGWYKINYAGDGGKTKTGYVSKDYVQTN